MAVWVDKVTGDTIQAADPNQLADGFSSDNSYNFGVDVSLKTILGYHFGGSHVDRIDFGDLKADAIRTVKILDKQVTNPKLADMARGTIKVGGVANAPTDLALGTAGKVLQSDGTDPGWVAISGDATLAVGGVLTVGPDKIDNTKLANIARGSIKVGGVADAPTDLDAKASGNILIGDGTDVKSIAMSGDVTITGGGVTAIGPAKVTLAMMADLASARIILGNGANRPAAVSLSGDVTMDNAGVTAIGPGKVLKSMVEAGLLSGKGNTAARPAASKAGFLYWNTQTLAIERDTDAAYEEVTGVIPAAQVTDLTDGGYTALHKHTNVLKQPFYVDHSVASPGGSGEAAALTEYTYTDPGETDFECKVRAIYDHPSGAAALLLHCQAQVDADPSPHLARIQVYVTDGGVDTASQIETITQYGSWAAMNVQVDVSALTPGLHYVEVRLAWVSDSLSGHTAKMRWVTLYVAQ